MVTQSHAVPQNVALSASRVGLFAVPTLANYILYCVDLLSTVSCVDHDVFLVLGRPHAHRDHRLRFLVALVFFFVRIILTS